MKSGFHSLHSSVGKFKKKKSFMYLPHRPVPTPTHYIGKINFIKFLFAMNNEYNQAPCSIKLIFLSIILHKKVNNKKFFIFLLNFILLYVWIGWEGKCGWYMLRLHKCSYTVYIAYAMFFFFCVPIAWTTLTYIYKQV